jgi:hypothetical protein
MTGVLAPEDILREMTKEQLIDFAAAYTRLVITIDGLWFLEAEGAEGLDEAISWDERVWRAFGEIAGRRLRKLFNIEKVETPEDICRFTMLSPMFVCLGGVAEVKDGICTATVTSCHPQKMRILKGLGEFPCKSVGIAYMEGLVSGLNPDIELRCIVCPPDEHSEDVWCRWEMWLD